MLFCSVVSFALVKGGLVEAAEGMSFEIYKVAARQRLAWAFASTLAVRPVNLQRPRA